jgi:hypothetical protein
MPSLHGIAIPLELELEHYAAWCKEYEADRCADYQERGRHFDRGCGYPGCPWAARRRSAWGAGMADGSLSTDNELSAAVASMYVAGLTEGELRAEWDRLACADDPADPWTDRDFRRHLSGAVRKFTAAREERITDRDWWDAVIAELGTSPEEITERQRAAWTVTRSGLEWGQQ